MSLSHISSKFNLFFCFVLTWRECLGVSSGFKETSFISGVGFRYLHRNISRQFKSSLHLLVGTVWKLQETCGCVELANGCQSGYTETFQMAPETNVEALKLLPWRIWAREYNFLSTFTKIETQFVFPVKHGWYFCSSVLLCVICESHGVHIFNESYNFVI